MSRLHIFLWLWRGWRAVYDRRDINAVATMLLERGHLPANTRIVLLTDQPTDWYAKRTEALGVEERRLWPDPVRRAQPGKPNCFRRLRLLDPETQAELGVELDDIVMSMDADSIVDGSIPSLLFPFHQRTHNFCAMGGLASRIHGSLFAFRARSNAHVWTGFHPVLTPISLMTRDKHGRRPIGSDQAVMSRMITGEFLWEREHGCYSWNRHGTIYSPRYTSNAVYWSFAGHQKPGSELVKQIRPDLHAIWMDAYNRGAP